MAEETGTTESKKDFAEPKLASQWLAEIKAYDTTNEGLIVCGVAPQFAKAYDESLGAAEDAPIKERRPKKKRVDKDHPFGIREAE